MLSADEVRERLGGLGSERIIGGAHMRDDLRVAPRTTLGRLADWLQMQPVGDIRFRHAVREVVAGETGEGADLDYLFPEIAEEGELGRCRLSMGRVVTPTSRR